MVILPGDKMAVVLMLPFGPDWVHIYGDVHMGPTFILVQIQCKNAGVWFHSAL